MLTSRDIDDGFSIDWSESQLTEDETLECKRQQDDEVALERRYTKWKNSQMGTWSGGFPSGSKIAHVPEEFKSIHK